MDISDQALDILKLVLLGLLYLFFARVLWAVWSEVTVPLSVTVRPGWMEPAVSSSSSRTTVTRWPMRMVPLRMRPTAMRPT